MKLANTATLALAASTAAFQTPSRTAQTSALSQQSLFGITPSAQQPGQAVNVNADASIRSSSSDSRATLTVLRASYDDIPSDTEPSPDEVDNDDVTPDQVENDEAPDASDEPDDSALSILHDEVKALADKYGDKLKDTCDELKSQMGKDLQDLKDLELGLIIAKVQEDLEAFADKHPELVDSIDRIIEHAEQLHNWVTSTKDFAEDNMPEFMQFNRTAAEEKVDSFIQGNIPDFLKVNKTAINEKLEDLKGKASEIPGVKDSGLISTVESFINKLFPKNETKDDGNNG